MSNQGERAVPPLDPAWRRVPVAAVGDALGRLGAMDAGIRRLAGTRLAGFARPVRTAAGDNSTIHAALEGAVAGEVVVIDAEGHLGRAVWGGVLTAAARRAGIAGAVIDGAIRDIDDIAESGFPLYARGICPAGPHKGFDGVVGVSVQCGGVVVHEGDLVVGDADGVVVVPRSDLDEVLARAWETVERERRWRLRIEAGESTRRIMAAGPKRRFD